MNDEQLPSMANWLMADGFRPADGVFKTRFNKVLHRCEGAMPFVVHTAYVHNGVWAYERGDYYATEEEARKGFEKRI
jgi:hypothetical protein